MVSIFIVALLTSTIALGLFYLIDEFIKEQEQNMEDEHNQIQYEKALEQWQTDSGDPLLVGDSRFGGQQ